MAKKSVKTADELIDEFEAAAKAVDEAHETMMEIGSEAFDAYTKSLFKKYPALDAFVILGWTPGFNDGDPCTHSMDVMISGNDFSDHGMEDEVEDILDGLGKLEDVTDEEVETALKAELAGRSREKLDEEDLERERRWKRQELEVDRLNKGLSEEVAKEIRSRIYAFDDVLESIYDTNWKLIFTRNKNGECDVEQTEYDCGH